MSSTTSVVTDVGEAGSTAGSSGVGGGDQGYQLDYNSDGPTAEGVKLNRTKKRTKKRTKTFIDEAGSERPTRIGKKYAVDAETGEVSYKKVKSSSLASSIQLGIRTMVSTVTSRKDRDLLHTDFNEVESRAFPKGGSSMTVPHHYDSFKFYSYASYAFRLFRAEFGINTAEFMLSVCDKPLIPLSNPGASGSVFYITHDDQFIIKTVQKGEHSFMRGLLPGYYMNLVQNKRTLLPKFFGLFCYQNNLKQNIRFVIMNNLLPTRLSYFQRFDLKGSTKGRSASKKEKLKKNPCYKDLDFNDMHLEGVKLEPESYARLKQTVERDGKVLESFGIMDYSLLVGIHRIGVDEVKELREISDSDFSDTDVAPSEAFFSASTALPENVRITISGAGIEDGVSVYINGRYEIMQELHNGKPFFRNLRLIPQGHGVLSGKPLFITFDATTVRWNIITEVSAKGTIVAFAPGDYNGPSDIVKGAWHVATVDGKFVIDKDLVATPASLDDTFDEEGDNHVADQRAKQRRRSMSFGTITEQLDLSSILKDVPTGQGSDASAAEEGVALENSDPFEGGLRAKLVDPYSGKMIDAVIYLGIIDVLQHFGIKKKIEHKYKSFRFDGDACSVHKPDFYRTRFENYMCQVVFREIDPESKDSTSQMNKIVSQVDPETIKKRIQGRAIGNDNFGREDSSSSREASLQQKSGGILSRFGSGRNEGKASIESSQSAVNSAPSVLNSAQGQPTVSPVPEGTMSTTPTTTPPTTNDVSSIQLQHEEAETMIAKSLFEQPTTTDDITEEYNGTGATSESDVNVNKSDTVVNNIATSPEPDWGVFQAEDAGNTSMLYDPLANMSNLERLDTPELVADPVSQSKNGATNNTDGSSASETSGTNINDGGDGKEAAAKTDDIGDTRVESPARDSSEEVKAAKAQIAAVRKERENQRTSVASPDVPTGESSGGTPSPGTTDVVANPTSQGDDTELDEFENLERQISNGRTSPDPSYVTHPGSTRLLAPVARKGATESLI